MQDRSKFLKFSPGLEISTDEENDESLYSADSEIGIKTNVYMFSKFMRDLEDLIETELPNFEKKIAEISSNFSEAHASTSAGLDRQNSGISITKTNSKSLLDVTSSPSDSDQESDTDNEAEDLDIQENSMIDLKVRNANIQRCNGRWSTRDIHDLKFNEDKLTVQFRTGRLGAFGFASNRYSNLPYQSWELKPDYKA